MKKLPYPHPALTVREQIGLLRAKGLLITEADNIEHWLSHTSYFRFKNYSYSFKDYKNAGGNYFPDTSFTMVKDLYAFDRKLRIAVFDAIENIEISVKTHISNIMSNANGAHWYLDSRHFFVGKGFNHQKFLKHIKDALLQTSEPVLQHYRKTYDPIYPPSWMLMEIITFRTLSIMFENMVPSDEKVQICHSFNLIKRQFVSWLQCFSFIRNKCAHHARLVYSKTIFPPSMPKRNNRTFLKEPVDNTTLYAVLSCLQYMLTICNPASRFKQNLLSLTTEFPLIDLQKLGFTPNWKQEKLWLP